MQARSGWLLIAALALAACSSSDHSPPATGVLPECKTHDLTTCDARSRWCQERLLALAACVYGVDSAPSVPVRVLSEQQLIDELNAAEQADADAPALASAPHIEKALVDLRLLKAGDLTKGSSYADLVNRVDGVYQDAEHGIALVDRGRSQDSAETNAVLLHEFVHAIQDAEYDLNAWRQQYSADVDTMLALRTVTEGQATYAQFRALYALSGYDLSRFDLSAQLDEFRRQLLSKALSDSSPYFASLATFPYAVGVHVAAQSYRATGLHFAAQQFEQPPLTTLAALGQSYQLDLPESAAPGVVTPEPPEGYTLVDQTVLGAFLLELSVHQAGRTSAQARELALDWRADKLWIYSGPEQQTAWLWQVELQNEPSSGADQPPDGVLRESEGRRLFQAGSDEVPDFLLEAGRAFLSGQR